MEDSVQGKIGEQGGETVLITGACSPGDNASQWSEMIVLTPVISALHISLICSSEYSHHQAGQCKGQHLFILFNADESFSPVYILKSVKGKIQKKSM